MLSTSASTIVNTSLFATKENLGTTTPNIPLFDEKLSRSTHKIKNRNILSNLCENPNILISEDDIGLTTPTLPLFDETPRFSTLKAKRRNILKNLNC